MSYDTATKTFSGQPATHVTCWCSVQFAVPTALYGYYERTNDKAPGSYALYCPLGHSMIPSDPHAPSNRLKDELARERHRAEQAAGEAEYQRRRAAMRERQLSARKGQITKLRKRVGNGVCPCCNRSFTALQRHMASQHPDWRPEAEEPITDTAETWAALADRREALGISIETAASAIGLTPSSLRAYERGTIGSLAAAKRLSEYLAAPPAPPSGDPA